MAFLRVGFLLVALTVTAPVYAEHSESPGADRFESYTSPQRGAPPLLTLPYGPSELRDQTPPVRTQRRVVPVQNPQVPVVVEEPAAKEESKTPVAVAVPVPIPHVPVAKVEPKNSPKTSEVTSQPAPRSAEALAEPELTVQQYMEEMMEHEVQQKILFKKGTRIFDRCSAEDPDIKKFPLLLAAARGHNNRVATLLAGGKKIDQRRGPNQQTALICAIENRRETTAKLLLDQGASPHIPNFHGTNPVAFAAVEQSPAMARMLMNRGARPSEPNGAGITAVRYANMLERSDIVAILTKR